VKIITTEDPIEYDMRGLSSAGEQRHRVTFASLLGDLRQDPTSSGREIRTLKPRNRIRLTHRSHGVQYAAYERRAGRVTRLRDMGTQPFLITATVRAILAQRLVRKICVNCREGFMPSPELLMGFA